MRRAPVLTTALLAAAGVALCAGAASAQATGAPSSEARGLRYLSWSGRGEVAPVLPVAAPAAVDAPPAASGRPGLRRPNTVIPHGGFAAAAPVTARPGLTPAPAARRTLTPANAWLRPLPPPPASAMAPHSPTPAPRPRPQPRPVPEYLPDADGRGQPMPAEIIYAPAPVPVPTPIPAPASVPAEPFDPMAPRRDAPIFRMQQEAPAPSTGPMTRPASAALQPDPQPPRVAEAATSGEGPSQSGGRYYSVHRQNGRQPDILDMPDPTYVDALAVTMPETIASQDLAAPQEGPALIRDAQGRLRPAPAASDGDHQ